MKLQFIVLLTILFSYTNLSAQNAADFSGVYLVEQICWSLEYLPTNDTIPPQYYGDTTQYELKVNIAANDTNDFELDIKILLKSYTLGFNIINDSVFKIHRHEFPLVSDTQQFIEGDGIFDNDSININLVRNVSTSTFDYNCSCKGKKIRDVEVSIDEFNLNKTITLYPNPVKNELQVLWPILSSKTYNYYRIFNTNGQSVLENKSQSFESIDVSELPFGTYIIHFLNDGIAVSSSRFVKIE